MGYINIDTVAVKVEEPVLESVENVNTTLQIKNVVLTSSERDKVKTNPCWSDARARCSKQNEHGQ